MYSFIFCNLLSTWLCHEGFGNVAVFRQAPRSVFIFALGKKSLVLCVFIEMRVP